MKQTDSQIEFKSLHLQNISFNSQIDSSSNKNSSTEEDFNYQCFKEMLSVRAYRKMIQHKIQELNEKRNKIYEKVVFYEKKTEEQFKDYIRGQAPQRKKRNRRNADEIKRQYNCPTCFKKYGSQGSMYQHIKLKHPTVYEPKKKGNKSEGSQSFVDHSSD